MVFRTYFAFIIYFTKKHKLLCNKHKNKNIRRRLSSVPVLYKQLGKTKTLPGRTVSGKEHNDKEKHIRLLTFINSLWRFFIRDFWNTLTKNKHIRDPCRRKA